jgi:hypothetical protein
MTKYVILDSAGASNIFHKAIRFHKKSNIRAANRRRFGCV